MSKAGQPKFLSGPDRRGSYMDSSWRQGPPGPGTTQRQGGRLQNQPRASGLGPDLLPDLPSLNNLRRGTMMQPTHVRQTVSTSDGSRRQTVVMPLMAFFSRQGRANSTSLSFRSGSMLFPADAMPPPPPLENTYRMEADITFPQGQARRMMAETLEERLQGKEYKASSMAQESKIISDLIKDKVKGISPPRYKLVSWVSIGQKGIADIRIASRGLWNEECDSYTQEVFENSSLYAVAVLYAIYQE